MNMKFLIVQLSVIAFIGSAYGAAVDNCHLNKLAACGDPVAEFRKKMGQSFPVTEEQVKELCENMKVSKDCAEEYQNKCMTPLQLETMGFMAEGPLVTYNEFCTEGSNMRTEYLKYAQCLDDASKTEEARNYYSYTEAALEDLSDKTPDKRLPTACCGYQWLQSRSEKMGKEKCGEDAVQSFRNVMQMAVSSLPEVFCTGFDPDSQECAAVLPPPGTKPKGNLKNSHIAQSFASIYIPDIQANE